MKIIEQGHCGGSEQKEGKWPWRHSIGKTPELPLCSRERWKQTRSHPEWETALRHSRPSPDGPGPVPRGTPWAMPPLRCRGAAGGLMSINASKACGQDCEPFKDTVTETKVCSKQRLKAPTQLPPSREGISRCLPVWQTWATPEGLH